MFNEWRDIRLFRTVGGAQPTAIVQKTDGLVMPERSKTALILPVILALGFGLCARRGADMMRIDREVLAFCLAHRSGAATLLMMSVTILGEEPVVLTAAALYGVISYARSRESVPGILLAIVGISSIVANRFAKGIFLTPRPPLKYMVIPLIDPGFPSAHAMNALSVYGTMAYLALHSHGLSLRYRCGFVGVTLFLIATIGSSRIYLGEHWLSDVLGGWAFGGLLLGLAVIVHQMVTFRVVN